MKKSLWTAAFIAAALSSCTQNEEIGNVVNSNSNAISFSTYVGKSTRAGITDIDALKGGNTKGFYVLGYSTGKDAWNADASTAPALNFMLNDQVYNDGTNWIYDNIKYWPNEVDGAELGKVSFFAYAPATIANVLSVAPTTAVADFPTLTYTCPTDPSAQKDVVAANAVDKVKTGGTVDLTFDHILSKIGFSAKLAADYDNATLTVTGLDVLYGTSLDNTNSFRLDKKEWGTASAKFAADATGNVLTDATSVLTWDDASDAANVISLNASATNYLMMIPQNVAAGALKAKLTYTVLDIHRNTTVTNVITVDLPEITWVKGNQYTYVLQVSETTVVFDNISVDPWANYDSTGGNTGVVDVP